MLSKVACQNSIFLDGSGSVVVLVVVEVGALGVGCSRVVAIVVEMIATIDSN